MGVPGGDSQDSYRNFVSKHQLGDIPQVANEDGDLWGKLGVSYQPRWVLIRADGSVERGGGAPPPDIVQDALSPA
ncbi:TlpA family protein disulfide reductase [Candidatus Poriferisodalis sp.]|uniref:TlpA family protein disulfide reductase n=1 Tax=Candidatus Poriferisodalis sp. TaxID=3101277 RepID=UPI003B015FBC